KPAVRGGAVPVLYTGRDIHHVAGGESTGRLAPFLVPAAARHAYQQLSAALFGVMYMPVVAAAGLETHVVHCRLALGQGLEIALPHKILRKGVVGRAYRERHLTLMPGAGVLRLVPVP